MRCRVVTMAVVTPILVGLFVSLFLLFYLLVDPAGWCQGSSGRLPQREGLLKRWTLKRCGWGGQ